MNADALPHLRSYQWQRIFESVQSSFAPPPLETYLARAGDPPPPPSKRLEVREHLQPTDWLIPILFVALLAVSLSHMITFAGELAHAVYKEPPVQFLGWWLDRELFVTLHQAAFFVFSEVGVLFFYTRHCLSRSGRGLSASLLSAAACALIAIYANVYAMVSGGDVLVGGFIGLLVPLLTMLLGERLAEVIRGALVDRRKRLDAYALQVAQHEERRAQMRQRYEADLERAARAAQDPIQLFQTPESLRLIAQRVVETYKNSAFGKQIDWSLNDELFVARREISRYLALYQAMQVVPEPTSSAEGAALSEAQSESPALNPSLDDKAEKLKRLLQENEAYRSLSGRQLAQRLVDDGHFEALTPQYVNKVRKMLDKN